MDGPDLQERPARAARRRVTRPLWVAGLAALAATLSSTSASGPAISRDRAPAASDGDATSSCPAPAQPPRYSAVAPIFERHCARCHDARQSDNAPRRPCSR